MSMERRPCKYCEKPIRWGVTARGRAVPLDDKPVKVFVPSRDSLRQDPSEPRLDLVTGYVAHHATCSGIAEARADAQEKRDAETEDVHRRRQERIEEGRRP